MKKKINPLNNYVLYSEIDIDVARRKSTILA